MTHYTVAIIIPPEEAKNVEGFVEQQMQPYDESIEVAPYVCYSIDQAASEIAESIHRFELILSRGEALYDLDRCREELARLRGTTAETQYREQLRYFEAFNDNGKPISTANPAGKWDWFVIGGRWDGWINDRETSDRQLADNLAPIESVLVNRKIPHAIITPDGVWHERGRMGWWAILATENENWDTEALRLFGRYPDHQVVLVDAHI